MSYLQMAETTLPDMNKGIISLWFRDATKGNSAPVDEWPSGQWSEETAFTTMVPPDTQTMALNSSTPLAFFWNAYGIPIGVSGIGQIGINGPALVYMPTPPFFPTDGIHMMLTFGDPNQRYDYYPWQMVNPGVTDMVFYADGFGFALGFQTDVWPPPYAPYYTALGSFKVRNMTLSSPVNKPNFVSQSFIGVDEAGYLVICLQTNTKADYKGCALMMDQITDMKATATRLEFPGPPYTYTQIGFPYPDGRWYEVPGYWNGYQFHYRDISNEVMAAMPETFVIGGPPVALDFVAGPNVPDNSWHHLLFSFDISGSVTSTQPADPLGNLPEVHSQCKAWLAVDDKNYIGDGLQRRIKLPDGFTAPLLPGMGHDVLPFGPSSSYARDNLSLGPNDIVPRNVFIHGFGGNPRDGVSFYASNTPVQQPGDFGGEWMPVGDFKALSWAAALWPLYGDGVAPGNWYPILEPPRPPDPQPLDLPTYSCSSFNLPVHGHPIGIPASARHLKHNTGIEMAELQIWAGQTLDTGDEKMRRLFIDYPRNEDGSPDTNQSLQPVDPSVAEEVLGKPDVLLHGNENWQEGINTGKSGTDPKTFKSDPNGQFTPVARIEKFEPEPEIGK